MPRKKPPPTPEPETFGERVSTLFWMLVFLAAVWSAGYGHGRMVGASIVRGPLEMVLATFSG